MSGASINWIALSAMGKENCERFADASRRDLKTAAQEKAFEVWASIATSEFAKSQLKASLKPVKAPRGSSRNLPATNWRTALAV